MHPKSIAPLLALLFTVTLPAQKAEEQYKNIEILKGVPAARIPAVMEAFGRFLGVACTHCHVDGKFEDASKPAYTRTREMFRMRAALNAGELHAYAPIGCWTCHRGQAKPAQANWQEIMQKREWPPELALTAEQESRPAEAVYKNIRIFKGVPAARLFPAMAVFSASLGVKCAHCHVEGDWGSDAKPAKETARQMMAMVRAASKEYFAGSGSLSCWTCHRGATSPERNPPAAQ
jgi:hypothetical protein